MVSKVKAVEFTIILKNYVNLIKITTANFATAVLTLLVF